MKKTNNDSTKNIKKSNSKHGNQKNKTVKATNAKAARPRTTDITKRIEDRQYNETRANAKEWVTVVARKTNKAGLPHCFLNEGENFIWLAKGGIAIEQQLPYVSAKYEEVLKEMGIPYRYAYIPYKSKEREQFAVCEYWKPSCPMQDRTLPVYIKLENSEDTYVFTGDYVTRQVVSNMTAGLASSLTPEVKYACAKKELDGRIATIVRRSKNFRQEVDFKGVEGGSIKILQSYKENGEPTGICGMFDMNKVAKVHYIEMNVPKDLVGVILGKGGQNIKFWNSMLGGKKVLVVAK